MSGEKGCGLLVQGNALKRLLEVTSMLKNLFFFNTGERKREEEANGS